MRTRDFIGAAAVVFGFFVSVASAEPAFEPRVVIPKAFPAIKEFPVVSAHAAGDEIVRDDELVLGVVWGSAARAYPINQLTGPRREIINDVLGELPLAATW